MWNEYKAENAALSVTFFVISILHITERGPLVMDVLNRGNVIIQTEVISNLAQHIRGNR